MPNPTSCFQCLHRNPGWVAKGLLMLSKGMTPDSGGRKRPFSRSRVRYHSVLPPVSAGTYSVYTGKYLQLKCAVTHWRQSAVSGQPEKISICLNRGQEEWLGNDDVSIVQPASKKWLGWRKRENALRGRLGCWFCDTYYLANRFHLPVHLFSNRSLLKSKCVKNKEVTHEPQASVSRYCTEPTGLSM